MATSSTGISVTFGSVTASEVYGLTWRWANGLPKSRAVGSGSSWSDDAGEVKVDLLGGISTSNWGTRDTLTITGGGMGLTVTAVCTSLEATAELNGVTRYSVTFKILQ